MLYEERPWTIFYLVTSLLLVWYLRFSIYDGESLMQLIFADEQPHPQDVSPPTLEPAESLFVQQAKDVEFPTPIDYAPIQQVCSREPDNFRPGLLFTCEGQHGGIGMLRNQILKCVRHAINAGAAIVVPAINLRNPKDLADIETENEVPLSYLMDHDAFVARLTRGCPGMRVYERAEDFPAYDRRVEVELVGDQFEPDHPPQGLQHPREWRAHFDAYLAAQNVTLPGPEEQEDQRRPVHVRLGQSFLEYPVHDDGEAFKDEFGKILSFREDTRALAAKVLWALQARFGLAVDPARAVTPGQYYGAHLRLEADALWAWPPAEWRFSRMADQFAAHAAHLAATGLRTVYVASGNQTVVDLFADYLKNNNNNNNNETVVPSGEEEARQLAPPIAVVTKYDLLTDPADQAALRALTFDQQALIDFLMMFRASAFMGVAHSSFPWNVALRRHALSRRSYANEGSDLLRDEYSVIMGMRADYPHVDPFIYGLWP